MTLNGEMALILRYFTEFGNGPFCIISPNSCTMSS